MAKFDIREWVEFDRSGRGACPSCVLDGKLKQKNLSVDLSNGKYHCFRNCTTEQIRAALNASKEHSVSAANGFGSQPQLKPQSQSQTFSQERIQQAQQRLLQDQGEPQRQALAWLESRGFTREMVQHFRLGLEQWRGNADAAKPEDRKAFWAISIFIPTGKSDQYYRKRRVAPWLTGEERPDYVPKWSQYGIRTAIWYTYRPDETIGTWYCEGEWDAMRLGWLAKQTGAKIAVCCSTSGCSTVPPQDQLEQLLGEVIVFFDRNDIPNRNGQIPGDVGAKKLALALPDRGKIAQVPMPRDCQVRGWDVSNALDFGFNWADFEAAAQIAIAPVPDEFEKQGESSGSIRDRVLTVLQHVGSESERQTALLELARDSGYSYRDLDKLAIALITELDSQIDQSEATRKLQDLLNTQPTSLDLNRYLEPWLVSVLIETAQAMPSASEFLFTTLLAAAASRVGTAATVIIKASARYTQPLIFWTAIVANSGSMKTPAQRVIIDPLVELEREAYESYLLSLANYKTSSESQKGKKRDGEGGAAPQPPTRKRCLTKDSTLETLQRIHAENPRGLLYYRDELAGNFKGRNQYRGGRGQMKKPNWISGQVQPSSSIVLKSQFVCRTRLFAAPGQFSGKCWQT